MSKLEHYGGQGYSYSQEIGKYEVRTNQGTREFTRLSEARAYFDSLKDEERAIWDITTIPELMDAYFLPKQKHR